MESKQFFIHDKRFYFVTELIVGMALMGIEMSASRLISVYFSSSQVVWTLIIGVIMISMAIGNYWGGKQADKKPSYLRLYLELMFAGAYVMIIPLIGPYVIVGVSAIFAVIVKSNLAIWASLVSCLILFVPPLLLMGKVTPSLIKYAMGEKVSGKVIGLLESLNTIGSIIGTFLPTFLTIPFIGTSSSFVLFGGLISLVGLIFVIFNFIEKGKDKKKEGGEIKREKKGGLIKMAVDGLIYVVIIALSLSTCIGASFVFWPQDDLIHEDESMYNYLKVDKVGDTTMLSTNILFGVQSAITDDDDLTGMYYDYLLPGVYLVKENPSVLVLGNGSGSFATMLKNYLKIDCDITAVEIDQKIIDLSYDYFHMNEEINIICDDGRNYLARNHDKYDIILIDAYSSISAPFQMTTVEFFKLVKEHLTDDGLMLMNINMYSETEGSISQALCDTVASVFDSIYGFKVPGGSGLEVYALNNGEDVLEKINNIQEYKSGLNYVINRLKNNLKEYEDKGIRLYDETADVEIRSIRALDEIVNKELEYYLNILEEKGIKGLIDSLLG